MIEYATLTGEIEKGQVGCSIYGRNFFARPVFNTAFQSIPSKAWLAKYSKKFFGVVTYENQKDNFAYDRPLLIGIVPTNNVYTVEQIEDKHFVQTEKFRIYINDTDGELMLERFDGISFHLKEDNAYISSKKINLGSENAEQQAVLGNKLVEWLGDFVKTLQRGKVLTSIGPQPFMPNTQLRFQEALGKLQDILSSVNKLD